MKMSERLPYPDERWLAISPENESHTEEDINKRFNNFYKFIKLYSTY